MKRQISVFYFPFFLPGTGYGNIIQTAGYLDGEIPFSKTADADPQH